MAAAFQNQKQIMIDAIEKPIQRSFYDQQEFYFGKTHDIILARKACDVFPQ